MFPSISHLFLHWRGSESIAKLDGRPWPDCPHGSATAPIQMGNGGEEYHLINSLKNEQGATRTFIKKHFYIQQQRNAWDVKLPTHLKGKIPVFQTILCPVMIHGAEARTVTKRERVSGENRNENAEVDTWSLPEGRSE